MPGEDAPYLQECRPALSGCPELRRRRRGAGRSPTGAPWSPFLSVYESSDGEAEADEPLREAYATLVNDLYDEEFDESLFELLTGARGLHQDRLASGPAPPRRIGS